MPWIRYLTESTETLHRGLLKMLTPCKCIGYGRITKENSVKISVSATKWRFHTTVNLLIVITYETTPLRKIWEDFVRFLQYAFIVYLPQPSKKKVRLQCGHDIPIQNIKQHPYSSSTEKKKPVEILGRWSRIVLNERRERGNTAVNLTCCSCALCSEYFAFFSFPFCWFVWRLRWSDWNVEAKVYCEEM